MNKESRIAGTNNYKVMAIVLLVLSILAGLVLITREKPNIGIITMVLGTVLFFTFMFMYSICYRLDLIIDKK